VVAGELVGAAREVMTVQFQERAEALSQGGVLRGEL